MLWIVTEDMVTPRTDQLAAWWVRCLVLSPYIAGQDDWTLEMSAETPRLSHVGDFPLLIGGFVKLGKRSMAILLCVTNVCHCMLIHVHSMLPMLC